MCHHIALHRPDIKAHPDVTRIISLIVALLSDANGATDIMGGGSSSASGDGSSDGSHSCISGTDVGLGASPPHEECARRRGDNTHACPIRVISGSDPLSFQKAITQVGDGGSDWEGGEWGQWEYVWLAWTSGPISRAVWGRVCGLGLIPPSPHNVLVRVCLWQNEHCVRLSPSA